MSDPRDTALNAEAVASRVVERMQEPASKPEWFRAHEHDDDRRFMELADSNRGQTKILETLKANQESQHALQLPMLTWFNKMTLGKGIRLELLQATGLWTGVIIGVAAVASIIWVGIKFIVTNAK